MKHFFMRISAFLEVSLGLNYLSSDFKKFATMHCAYNIFQGLVSVYITTLLMRVSGNGDIVIWYNLVNFFFHGCSLTIAVVIMRKGSVNLATRCGIMGFIILYTVLLFTMSSADKFMPLFGLLTGMSNGFYWLTYATYFSAFTVDNKRDVALGFMGFVNGVITLIMPTLSGFLIEQIGGFTGYTVVFGISFSIAVVTILLSFRLPKQVNPPEVRKTYFRQVLKVIVRDSCVRCGMVTETLRGVRDGTFGFLLNLLLFEVISSEALMGINSLLTSIAAIVSYWVAGRIIKPHNRVKFMFAATTVLLLAASLPAFGLSPATIMIFAVVNSFFNTFIINPSNSIMFLIVQRKADPKMVDEYFSLRDIFLVAGRMIGVCILLAFPRVQYGYVIAIVVLTLSQFITSTLDKHCTTLLNRMEASPAPELPAEATNE
ncbi:MAG: MFS transporter [Oscillospiraceae bacterium]|jgi:YQGE family putative transporter